jgi:hypothetical protein
MIAFWDLNDWDFEILSIEIVNCVCYPFIFSHIFYIFLYFFIFFIFFRIFSYFFHIFSYFSVFYHIFCIFSYSLYFFIFFHIFHIFSYFFIKNTGVYGYFFELTTPRWTILERYFKNRTTVYLIKIRCSLNDTFNYLKYSRFSRNQIYLLSLGPRGCWPDKILPPSPSSHGLLQGQRQNFMFSKLSDFFFYVTSNTSGK